MKREEGGYGWKRSASLSLLSSKIPQGLLCSKMNKSRHLHNRKTIVESSACVEIIFIIFK